MSPLPALVTGPLVTPPRLTLLDAFQVVDETDDRFVQGITFEPESCGTDGQVLDACEPAEKSAGEQPEPVSNEAFLVSVPDRCSALSNRSQEEFEARARRRLDAFLPWLVEREFWTGTLNPTSQHLADSAEVTDLTPAGGAVSLVQALACLEEALGDCQRGGRGVIHVTRNVATEMAAARLLRREGGLLLTYLDTLVVPGAGYPGTAPDGSTSATSEYAYATGVGQIRRGRVEVYPRTMTEATDRSVNTVTFRAERPVAVSFDPCCLLGIEVEALTCIGGS